MGRSEWTERKKAMRVSGGNRAGRVSIRVYFNQLALFADDPVESTAEEAAGLPMTDMKARTALGEAILNIGGSVVMSANRRDLEQQNCLDQPAWEMTRKEWALPQEENKREKRPSVPI